MEITQLKNGQIVGVYLHEQSYKNTWSHVFFDFFLDCNKNGRYKDYGAAGEICELCDSEKSCDYETCSGSDIIRYPLIDNTSCFMVKAPKGYSSIPINGQYLRCKDPFCGICYNPDICESCFSAGFTMDSTGLKKECIANTLNYYLNTSTNIYEKCDIACNGCTNATNKNCINCNTTSNYFPLPDKINECYSIYNSAPLGYYKTQNISWGKCDIACNGCTNATNKFCIACNTTSIYFTDCYYLAPLGYYKTQNNTFEKCDIACNGCTNATNKNCINCNTTSNYFPLPDKTNECYSMNNESPLGYFKTQNNSWGKCDIACNGCTDATNCISCNNAGKYFHKESTPNICTNIQPGYFQFENKWKLCDISCETCDQSEKYCTKCKLGYFPLEDNAQQCFLKTASPARYIFDETNKIHIRCDISCEICRDKPDFCLYCNKIGKYYNTQKEPNKCTNTVPVNHFFDTNSEMYLTVTTYSTVTPTNSTASNNTDTPKNTTLLYQLEKELNKTLNPSITTGVQIDKAVNDIEKSFADNKLKTSDIEELNSYLSNSIGKYKII